MRRLLPGSCHNLRQPQAMTFAKKSDEFRQSHSIGTFSILTVKLLSAAWLRANDRYLALGSFGKGVQDAAIGIQMAQRELLGRNRKVAEAIYLLRKGAALGTLNLEVVEIRSTASGEEVAGGVPLEFKMLQIVVVPREVHINLVFLEQRVPVADQDRVIAMRPIRVNRVMAHDN